jgi:hypothetical protein
VQSPVNGRTKQEPPSCNRCWTRAQLHPRRNHSVLPTHSVLSVFQKRRKCCTIQEPGRLHIMSMCRCRQGVQAQGMLKCIINQAYILLTGPTGLLWRVQSSEPVLRGKPPDPTVPHTATDVSNRQACVYAQFSCLIEADSMNKTVLCVARLLPSVRKVVDRCTHTCWGVMEALLHFQPQRCHKLHHTSHPHCCNCAHCGTNHHHGSPNERSRTLACLGSTSP